MEKIFGIDLGTTNSEIAYVKDGKPEIVTTTEGRMFLPSVVGVDSRGEIITGFAARNQYAAYPENTVVSIKRKMGSGEKVLMAGRRHTAAEISSHILRTLKESAERETGMVVNKAVITVPAYFNDAQRTDTIRAGELAGLEVVRIINEPTAAALAYGCRQERRERILVYDLGGGTFDISLVDVEKGVIEVIATNGDTRLGGDDFDRLLSVLFLEHLPEGLDPEKDPRLAAGLKNAAEEAKIALSTRTMIDVREGFLAAVEGEPVNLELSVTRREFERRIEKVLGKTFDLLEGVLKEKKLGHQDISKVLLVGGSTYIPRIFHVLAGELGFDVHREVDPTYCVAVGAAIQGAIIAGEETETILVDVNAHSLGIRCLHFRPLAGLDSNKYSIILPRNTPIPASMSETYHTLFENQKEALIEVYQGENPVASHNTPIGSFALDSLPGNLPAGSEIDVTFEYDLNGVVEITACERTSGKKERIKVDINRIESGKGDTEGTSKAQNTGPKAVKTEARAEISSQEKGVEKKARRILKTAEKKLSLVENPRLLERMNSAMRRLEESLVKNEAGVAELSEELAALIAET